MTSRENDNKISLIDPVFIVGAPRSGTSLLRVLLNRHAAFGLCDETYFFYYVYHRQQIFGDLQNLENRRFLIERYLETDRIRRLNLNLDDLKKFLLEEATDYPSFFIALLKFFAESRGKRRYGEKTPQHAFEVETLCRIYPQCRLIHIVRDPRDVVASLKRMPWGSSSIAANARLWAKSVQSAQTCRERENFLLVKYESLVDNPEFELQRVCEFLSEPYEHKMLEADDEEKKDMHWWFRRARTSIDATQIEKWRNELTPEQVAVVEWITGETMRNMGYSLTSEIPSLTHRAAALAHEKLTRISTRTRKLPSLWYHWMRPNQLAAEESWIDNYNSDSKGSDRSINK
jgi:hypothetical protein